MRAARVEVWVAVPPVALAPGKSSDSQLATLNRERAGCPARNQTECLSLTRLEAASNFSWGRHTFDENQWALAGELPSGSAGSQLPRHRAHDPLSCTRMGHINIQLPQLPVIPPVGRNDHCGAARRFDPNSSRSTGLHNTHTGINRDSLRGQSRQFAVNP